MAVESTKWDLSRVVFEYFFVVRVPVEGARARAKRSLTLALFHKCSPFFLSK